MADIDLRKRLAAAAGVSINDKILDDIHEQLKASDGALKIPVTLKYVFSVDDAGVMEAEISASCNLNLYKHTLSLRGDGHQLQLAYEADEEPDEEDEEDDLDPDEDGWVDDDEDEEDEAVRVAEEARAKLRAKKSSKKKSAKKKGLKAKGAKSKDPKKKRSPKKGEKGRANAAKSAHASNAEELFREGAISREMAIAGGVDVDSILGEPDQAPGHDRPSSLSPAEIKALESSLA